MFPGKHGSVCINSSLIVRVATALPSLVRRISLSAVYNKVKNHYDSLGLTPHATQADIKSAYYKLSMQYHPDKNKGSEEASQRFRDITEAYEVLGNLKLRKLYDKGVLPKSGTQPAQSEEDLKMQDDSQAKFYKSRFARSQAPTSSGKTSIYDFDEWTQAHYGSSFARREAAKARYEWKAHKEKMSVDRRGTEFAILLSVFVGFFIVVSYLKESKFDDVKVETPTNGSTVNISENG